MLCKSLKFPKHKIVLTIWLQKLHFPFFEHRFPGSVLVWIKSSYSVMSWAGRLYLPNFVLWNPNPKVIVVGGGAFGKSLNQESGAHMNGINVLRRGFRAS